MSGTKQYAPLEQEGAEDEHETGGLLGDEAGDRESEEERLARNAGPAPSLSASSAAIGSLAYPMTISSVLDNLSRQITIMMVGHLGEW